jgi:hypothetical protein
MAVRVSWEDEMNERKYSFHVLDVLELSEINDPDISDAINMILTSDDGSKDKNIQEAIDSLKQWQQKHKKLTG